MFLVWVQDECIPLGRPFTGCVWEPANRRLVTRCYPHSPCFVFVPLKRIFLPRHTVPIFSAPVVPYYMSYTPYQPLAAGPTRRFFNPFFYLPSGLHPHHPRHPLSLPAPPPVLCSTAKRRRSGLGAGARGRRARGFLCSFCRQGASLLRRWGIRSRGTGAAGAEDPERWRVRRPSPSSASRDSRPDTTARSRDASIRRWRRSNKEQGPPRAASRRWIGSSSVREGEKERARRRPPHHPP
jgi:hypothetical protein